MNYTSEQGIDVATQFFCEQRGFSTMSKCIGNSKVISPIDVPIIYGFVVALIVKGQAYRLAYWIAWHLHLGVERIMIFDNGKNYGISLLKSERVEIHSIRGHSVQIKAYDIAIHSLKRSGDYFVGCWDVDEFLLPRSNVSLSDLISTCRNTNDCAGLRFNTLVSEGVITQPQKIINSPLWNITSVSPHDVVKTIVRVSQRNSSGR